MALLLSNNLFSNFCSISKKVQEMQTKITSTPIDSKERYEMHKELETLQDALIRLREEANFTQKQANLQFSQMEEVEKQIITLYRVIEERFEAHKITLISTEALEIGNFVEAGKMVKVAKRIATMKYNIEFLYKQRKPSIKNRTIVNLALKMADHATALVENRQGISNDQIRCVYFLKDMLHRLMQLSEEMMDPAQAELAMEFHAVADLFLEKRGGEGRLRLDLLRSRLSKGQRRLIDAVKNCPKRLVQMLRDLADDLPFIQLEQPEKQRAEIIQLLPA